jgi:hypothetical protein
VVNALRGLGFMSEQGDPRPACDVRSSATHQADRTGFASDRDKSRKRRQASEVEGSRGFAPAGPAKLEELLGEVGDVVVGALREDAELGTQP